MRAAQCLVVVAILIGALAQAACVSTVVTPRIAGRVVDKRTGEPVAGASIVIDRFSYGTMRYPSGYSFGAHWTTTDAEGRFDFPEHRDPPKTKGRVEPRVSLWVYHPAYGSPPDAVLPRDPNDWDDATIAIEPDARSLEEIQEWKAGRGGSVADSCSTMGDRESYFRCCQLVYQDDDCARK